MKKRVFKHQKAAKACKARRRMKKVSVLAAAFGLIFGMALSAHGQESSASGQKVVVSNIYHRHIGSASAEGGCYSVPVKHTHQGNAQTGGACYGTPVTHSHTGSAAAGGGCYIQPVYHAHQGDESSGGACYEAIMHTHSDVCYLSGTCTVQYTLGALLETYDDDCFQHQRAVHERRQATAAHSSCGKGTIAVELKYCRACSYMPTTWHQFNNVVCGMNETTVTGYRLKCGKTGTVERYNLGCGYNQGQIISYNRTCNKTVDGYERGCGLNENTPCGKVILTNETSGSGEKVTISVRVEDLSGGKLTLGSQPYTWQDQNGNTLGSGSSIEVSENGTYQVTVRLENKDVDASGLKASIQVDNVYRPVPTATPTVKPTAKPTTVPTASPTAKPTAAPTATPTARPTQAPTAEPTQKPTAKPTAAPTASPTAKPTEKPTEKPTTAPAVKPTEKPVVKPTARPTAAPTATPSVKPTEKPAVKPTIKPAASPTIRPVQTPSPKPVIKATPAPTPAVSGKPSGGNGNGHGGSGKDEENESGSESGSSVVNRKEEGQVNKEEEKKEAQDKTLPGKGSSGGKGSSNKGNNSEGKGKGGNDKALEEAVNTEDESGIESANIKKPVMKETESVRAAENKGEREIPYMIGQKSGRNRFFAQPAVKVITITVSSLLLLAGIFTLLFYLRRSVKVYNDDGEGKMIYLGRCMVSYHEDGYAVTITERMVENSCTNRYCIKPGFFKLGKKEDQELIIHKEDKKTAVYLSREMIVLI